MRNVIPSLSLSLILVHVCSYLLECNDVIRVNWRCRIGALYPRRDATINREAARRCPPLIYKTMIRERSDESSGVPDSIC